MATLSGRAVNAVYQGFLNIDNASLGIDGTLRSVQDGLGNTAPLQLSTGFVNITALKYNGTTVNLVGSIMTSNGTLSGITSTIFAATNWPLLFATAAGSQVVTQGTSLNIIQYTASVDTNSNFASNKYTPTVAGYYLVTVSIGSTDSNASNNALVIYKNGSTIIAASSFITNTSGANNGGTSVSAIVNMNGSTDYIEGRLTAGAAGGNLTISASSLTISRVG